LCALPSSYPSSHSTILTGSSDGLIRVVQLLPTKLLGIVTDHGDYPVERIVIDHAGEGRWVGSIGHEDVLKLTDLKDVFEDEDDVEEEGSEDADIEKECPDVAVPKPAEEEEPKVKDPDSDEPKSEEEPESKKRKKKRSNEPLAKKREKKGRNEILADPSFFSGL
jgi:WD repeat-containing protein 55